MIRMLSILLLAGTLYGSTDPLVLERRDQIEKIPNYLEGYQAAKKEYQKLKEHNHSEAWDFHSLMVYFLTFEGEYEKAEQLLRQTPEDSPMVSDFAHYFYKLAQGRARQFQGELNDAKRFYHSCLVYAEKLKQIKYKVTPLIALAYLSSQQGQTADVLKFLAQLQDIAKTSNDETRALIYAESGGLYFDNEDYTNAIHYGKKAVEMAEKKSRLPDLASMHANLGLYYAVDGQAANALVHRQRALAISQEVGNSTEIARRVLAVGDTHIMMENWGEAYRILKDLPSVFDKAKHFRFQVQSRRSLASALKGLERFDEALQLFRKARSLLESSERTATYDKMIIELLDEERKLLALMNLWPQAYETSTVMTELERRNNQEKNRRDLNEFRVKYDSAIKEKENELLAHENKLAELALEREKQRNQFYVIVATILTGFVLILIILLLIIARILKQLKQAKDLTESQAQEITLMLARIEQGVFMVHGPQLVIHQQASTYARQRFQLDAGSKLHDFLSINFELSAEELSITETVLSNSIDLTDLGFSIDSEKLPKVLKKQAGSDTILFEVDWVPLFRGQDQTIEGYLICIRDVTEIRRATQEQFQAENQLKMVGALLNCGHQDFQAFHESFTAHEKMLDQVINAHVLGNQTLQIVKQQLHTLKGLARSYMFQDLSGYLHKVEDLLNHNDETIKWENLRQGIDQIKRMMGQYHRIAIHQLGWNLNHDKTLVDSKLLKDTLDVLKREPSTQQTATIIEQFEKLLVRSKKARLHDLIKSSGRALAQIAQQLNKAEPELIITGQDLDLSEDHRKVLRGIIQHLLRNSLDHGLESNEIRLAAGKSLHGRIYVETHHKDEALVLFYRDDGSGLNLPQIYEKALAQGFIEQGRSVPASELAELIFLPGFSTKRTVSDISGRGVGMDAVRSLISSLGGIVEMRLAKPDTTELTHQAFTLVIKLPLSQHQPEARPVQAVS